jgi:hypothetical protein
MWGAASLVCFIGLAHGEIRFNTDWSTDFNEDGTRKPRDQNDRERLEDASDAVIYRRDAWNAGQVGRDSMGRFGGVKVIESSTHFYKLFVNEAKYFLQPKAFTNKSYPGEVCTPMDGVGSAYECKEGQRRIASCHLIFFDGKFAEVGFNTVKVNEPYPFNCDLVESVGVRAKGGDDLLVTVQHSPIDKSVARKFSNPTFGWNRTTVLFHIKAVDGKIIAEQDDTCLGNPNRIDNIPDARKRLAKCMAGVALKQ